MARIAVVCALGSLPASPAAASERPVVVFTVDVESEGNVGLPAQVDAVCSDGSPCGLMEIVRLLEERDWQGTFFLSVYEQSKWGEPALRNIAGRLHSSGQDVGLHTHPHWTYDAARPGMHEYTLEEQTAIIRDGVRYLRSWTGLPVVAHRAGAYAADERTLIALNRNGVLLDSSLFWNHPSSKLDGLGLPTNFPGRHQSVLQIPVSAYQRQDRPAIFGNFVAPVTVVRKIDPNWFVDASEARGALDALVALDVPVIVVFLHSFSLMTTPQDGAPLPADRHAREMFRVILDYVTEKQLDVVTMRDLASGPLPARTGNGVDRVPGVPVSVDVAHYAWRRAKATDRWTLGGSAALPLLTAAVMVLRRRRQAAADASRAVRVNLPSSVGKGVQVQ